MTRPVLIQPKPSPRLIVVQTPEHAWRLVAALTHAPAPGKAQP